MGGLKRPLDITTSLKIRSFGLFLTTSNNGKHHCQRLPFSLDLWVSWSNSVPLSINTSNKHYSLLIIYNVPCSEPVFLSLKLGPVGFRFCFLHHLEEMESLSCVQCPQGPPIVGLPSKSSSCSPTTWALISRRLAIPNTSHWTPIRRLLTSPWTDDSWWGLINTKSSKTT